jgi:hypothetical protein
MVNFYEGYEIVEDVAFRKLQGEKNLNIKKLNK